MRKLRRTKIVATLGPATSQDNMLRNLIGAGCDAVRVSCSHGTESEHRFLAKRVRRISAELSREIALIFDLQGPKIRIGEFKNAEVELTKESEIILDANLDLKSGTENRIGITYKNLPQDVIPGDILLLDDGLIELQVASIKKAEIFCRVLTPGILKNNKGINRLGGGLSAEVLTDKDKKDIALAVELEVDYIALSFPRNAQDVDVARQLIQAAGGQQAIIAKIERSDAVENLDAVITAADAVMVARGDLALEIGAAEVPAVQKKIINRATALNKPVITATQMMESMINQPIPTRAEVSDVANAILDGTDAVMLSAETAVGRYPIKVIEELDAICLAVEKHPLTRDLTQCLDNFERIDQAIAIASMFTANHLAIQGIIALTESGMTVTWMSRVNSNIPIYGLSRHADARRRMTLCRGVYPVAFDPTVIARDDINQAAVNILYQDGVLDKNDQVILTKGDSMGVLGGTNAMKILRVMDVIQ